MDNEKSKTDLFKEHLQMMAKKELGCDVSKAKAWALFKAFIHGTVEFVENIQVDENDTDPKKRKLPLNGIGTFCILESKPSRGYKAGLDKDGNPMEGVTPWAFVPRYKFYPSLAIEKKLEQDFGFEDHGIKEVHYGLFDKSLAQAEKSDAENEI